MEAGGRKPGQTPGQPGQTPGEQPETGVQPSAGAKPSAGAQAPAPAQAAVPWTPEQRLEDLRARLARIERKLGVRTYALGAGVVLALAAGIVGVVLALSAKDESATKDEVRGLRDQVEVVQQEASEAAEEDVATVTDQLEALEGRVNTIAGGQRTTESELSVVQDDIDDLRSQISGLETQGGGAGGGGGGNP